MPFLRFPQVGLAEKNSKNWQDSNPRRPGCRESTLPLDPLNPNFFVILLNDAFSMFYKLAKSKFVSGFKSKIGILKTKLLDFFLACH